MFLSSMIFRNDLCNRLSKILPGIQINRDYYMVAWILSYQAQYHPKERGINPRPKSEDSCLFSRDDVVLDTKVTMS